MSRAGRKQTFRAHIPPHLPVFPSLFSYTLYACACQFLLFAVLLFHIHTSCNFSHFGGLLCRTQLQRFDSSEDQLAVNMRRSCFFFSMVVFSRVAVEKDEGFSHFKKTQCASNFRADQIPVLWKKKKSTHFQLIKLPSNTWYAMNLGALVHLRGPGAPGCTWLAGKENKSRMKQGWTAYVCFY